MTRLRSIDVFRGITVALMILVNSMSDNGYSLFLHSPWNGCTLADLVFPFFIFIVGLSAGFSISASLNKGQTTHQILYKIIKRTVFLLILGLLINAFPKHFDVATLRFCGVLQRIAICYFAASALFLLTSIRAQIIIMVTLLLGYWLALTKGISANQLTVDGNLAADLDRLIIPVNHLYQKTFDPEGILSSFPAIATCIAGVLLAVWLQTQKTARLHLSGIISMGLAAMACGWLWGLMFPINKILWSSSYVLWTAGLGLLVFAFCLWICDIKGRDRFFKPFELFGKNALIAFVLHVLFLKAQASFPLKGSNGTLVHLNQLLTDLMFPHFSPANAALLFSLSFTVFWLVVIWGLRTIQHRQHRSKIRLTI